MLPLRKLKIEIPFLESVKIRLRLAFGPQKTPYPCSTQTILGIVITFGDARRRHSTPIHVSESIDEAKRNKWFADIAVILAIGHVPSRQAELYYQVVLTCRCESSVPNAWHDKALEITSVP